MNLTTMPCVKCGEGRPSIEWTGQTETTTIGRGIEYIGGEMVATCRRCGYQWTIEALDEKE